MSKKRVMAGALAFAMLLSAAACGKGESAKTTESGSSKTSEDIKNCVFKSSDRTYDGFEGTVSHMDVIGDNLIFDTYETVLNGKDADEADSSLFNIRVYSVPVTGGTAKQISEIKNTAEFVNNIYNANGNIGIWLSEYDQNDGESGRILVMDQDGKESKDIDLGFAYKDGGYLTNIYYIEDKDSVVSFFDDKISVSDTEGKEKFSLDTNGYLMNSCLTKDNVPVIEVYSENGDEEIKTIDLDSKSYATANKYEGGILGGSFRRGTSEYDFVCSTKSTATGYKLPEKKSVTICDFTASDIDTSKMSGCVVVDADNLIVASESDTASQLEAYTKIDPSEYVEKKELTLMCLYMPSDIRSLIVDYNKKNPEYRIIVKNYSDMDGMPYDLMSADIAAGNIPDIFFVGGGIGNLSIRQCISKGMFEDLTPYIEKDPDISEDDFIPSVYNATKVDGKVYYLGGHFSVNALFGKKSIIGDRDGWTISEFKEFIDSAPENSRIFETTDKAGIFQNLLPTCLNDFVDWENGSCSFDSPEFQAFLQICNRNSGEEFDPLSSVFSEDMQSGKQLLATASLTPDILSIYSEMLGGDERYIGYPCSDRKGVYVSLSDSFAISSVCENKDAAWDFIKLIASSEYQGKTYVNSYYGCPIRKDIYDMYLKTFTATEDYKDEFGNEISVRSGSMGMADGINVDIKPLSNEEISKFTDLVDDISLVMDLDQSLDGIIGEETAAYFAGDKTVDETSKLIQNRAQTYIQENR